MSSFWDRYLAPGDLRNTPHPPTPATPPPAPSPQDAPSEQRPPQPAPEPRIDAAHRQRRQQAMLYGGLAFTGLSLWVTRRTLARKHAQFHAAQLALKTSAPGTPFPAGSRIDGGFEAAEALGLATLNVAAIAMASLGAAMTWFDVADIEDMRERVRKGVGFDVYGGDSAADRELEAWVADVLARKDGEGELQENIAGKLKELAEMDQRRAEEERERLAGR
ncbi:hypothetical protein LTR08_005951 [Meristemomyces frigidus]|nr:hypothetical protein LTR08_005951 [Meristemomyces frigidus]